MRGIKDLDQAATVLATACRTWLDPALADSDLRDAVFTRIPREVLTQALASVNALVRPPDDVYYRELNARYRAVRIFLPTLLQHIRFGASPAGEPVEPGFDWLRIQEMRVKSESQAPRDVITKPWQRHVLCEDGSIDPALTHSVCLMDCARHCIAEMSSSARVGTTPIRALDYSRAWNGRPRAPSFAAVSDCRRQTGGDW